MQSTESLITDLCTKQAAVSCATATTEQSCLAELHTKQGYAQQEGCEAELDAYLKCANEGSIVCEGYDGESHPAIDSSCGGLNDAFWECYTRISSSGCSVGVGPGTGAMCTLSCPNVSASCQGTDPNGPVECICNSGPHTGTKFQADNCSLNMAWATGHTCL